MAKQTRIALLGMALIIPLATQATPNPVKLNTIAKLTPTLIKNNSSKQLLDEYYAIKPRNPTKATAILKRVLRTHPNNVEALTEMGYTLSTQNRSKEALPYLLRAQRIQPKNHAIQLQIAYNYESMGDITAARKMFEKLSHVSEPEVRQSAQKELAAIIKAGVPLFNTKILPTPWFGDLYFAPYYSSRFNDFIFPLQFKIGRNFGPFAIYSGFRYTQDTRSKGGKYPDIIEDNAAIAALGISYQPISLISFYVEYGAGYDLVFQNRNRWRKDFRAGTDIFQAWGAATKQVAGPQLTFEPLGDIYASAAYYSRYNDNIIGDLRLRQGVRFFEWNNSSVDLYGKGEYFFDTKHEYYNNAVEAGIGIAFTPYNRLPLTLRVEQIRGFYIKVNSPDQNPYGKQYNNTTVTAEFELEI